MNPDIYSGLINNIGWNPDRNSIHLTKEISSDDVHWINIFYNFLFTEKFKDTTIFLSCVGGDMYSTLAIIDMIYIYNDFGIKTGTTVLGSAFSGATLIAIAGTGERSMTEHSYMMFHDIWTEESKATPASQSIKESRHLENMQENMLKIIEKYTKFSYSDAAKLLSNSSFFNAEECLEHGMVDTIKGV